MSKLYKDGSLNVLLKVQNNCMKVNIGKRGTMKAHKKKHTKYYTSLIATQICLLSFHVLCLMFYYFIHTTAYLGAM